MKVLFWVPYPNEGASVRYRVNQYLPYLEKEGIKYVVQPFWSCAAFNILYKRGYYLDKLYFLLLGTLSRIWDLLNIFNYDIVFIHREAYPIGWSFLEYILFLLNKPIIFDFDDAVFLPNSSADNRFLELLKYPNKIFNIIKISSYIIAGNTYLANFALKYNREVSVIPTPVDTNKYYPSNKNQYCNEVVIGWIGSLTTLKFLYDIKDVFIALSRNNNNNIRFKIIGGNFYIDGLTNIESKPWALDEELEDLKTFDIGIMPMPDNEWTMGKCGFKALLYMGMGIPCVCSSVGANKEIVLDGITGFLVDSDEAWIDRVERLIKNAELRKSMGNNGRKRMEEKYSVLINSKKYINILRDVYDKRYN